LNHRQGLSGMMIQCAASDSRPGDHSLIRAGAVSGLM
jgi:hypothetical protein